MVADHNNSLIALEHPQVETLSVPVLKVFDGDGFLARISLPDRRREVEVGIRLGFIDAPEMDQPGGHQARDFLNSLIGGKWVELVILTKMDTGGIVDRHGRIVAVPYLKQESNFARSGFSSMFNRFLSDNSVWRNVELEMVLNGWAWVLERYGPDDRYFNALEDARRHRRGIWSFNTNIHPWEHKKRRYAQGDPKSRSRPTAPLLEVEYCPVQACGGRLVERNGKFGRFRGCSNFPKCRYSRS